MFKCFFIRTSLHCSPFGSVLLVFLPHRVTFFTWMNRRCVTGRSVCVCLIVSLGAETATLAANVDFRWRHFLRRDVIAGAVCSSLSVAVLRGEKMSSFGSYICVLYFMTQLCRVILQILWDVMMMNVKNVTRGVVYLMFVIVKFGSSVVCECDVLKWWALARQLNSLWQSN